MAETADLTPLARTLGRIPTGLYIVATRGADGPLGFVGSFLVQVGFEPPTVCVAIGQGRDHLDAIRSAGRFAVSILDGPSSGLMGPFFKKYPAGESAFDHVDHEAAPGGSPVLSGALAWFECALAGEHNAGDHVVLFGRAAEARLLREGDPSVHLRQNGLAY